MIKNIKNKKIFITGGTGSLGKALSKKLLELNNEIIVFSRDEGKHALLFGKEKQIKCIIGDVRDFDKLKESIHRTKPDIVIHTAALKRIDDLELHPDECIKTNIQGSQNVAKAALDNSVEKCILISTDKACEPINVYGSSKFIAERTFVNFDYHSNSTIFSSVRYGNVIASRGSFIPLWMDLLSRGQKIKVTSMDTTRFLFTLNDAVETVLNSIVCSEGGETFIPKIDSYNMETIIKAIQSLHGKNVEKEIIGMRIGEKLHEDMLASTELPSAFEVNGQNILAVRPQYSRRAFRSDWKKYEGQVMNSALHINNNVETLKSLILRGIDESK